MIEANVFQTAIEKFFAQNVYVNKCVDDFFRDFNSEMLKDFLSLLQLKDNKNALAIVNKKVGTQGLEATYDFDNNLLTLKITDELDFLSRNTRILTFSFHKSKLGFLETIFNSRHPKNIVKFVPELSICYSSSEPNELSLLNQSHSTSIADLEITKQEKQFTFSYNNQGQLTFSKIILNQGRVINFGVNRLKNKEFSFLANRTFNFDCSSSIYPVKKEYSKRFLITHKHMEQAWLSEEAIVQRINNMEVVEYYNDGSPLIYSQFADKIKSKNGSFYLRKCPQSALDILPDFSDTNCVPIDEKKVEHLFDDPTIAEKIYTRNKKKEYKKNHPSMFEK